MNDKVISPFYGQHDHANCTQGALDQAEAVCASNGRKLTALRKEVLTIVWQTHKPVGAYDVLDALRQRGHKPSPPTAYRALDFLVNARLIHRLESLNAYIGCPAPGKGHQGQFLICTQCKGVAEIDDPGIVNAIDSTAASLGFNANQQTIEITGLCESCLDNPVS